MTEPIPRFLAAVVTGTDEIRELYKTGTTVQRFIHGEWANVMQEDGSYLEQAEVARRWKTGALRALPDKVWDVPVRVVGRCAVVLSQGDMQSALNCYVSSPAGGWQFGPIHPAIISMLQIQHPVAMGGWNVQRTGPWPLSSTFPTYCETKDCFPFFDKVPAQKKFKELVQLAGGFSSGAETIEWEMALAPPEFREKKGPAFSFRDRFSMELTPLLDTMIHEQAAEAARIRQEMSKPSVELTAEKFAERIRTLRGRR